MSKSKAPSRKVLLLCGFSASLCIPVNGQAPSDNTALIKANQMADQAFVRRCGEKPFSTYVGPASTGGLVCADIVQHVPNSCHVVIEYKIEHKDPGRPFLFTVKREKLTPADEENQVVKWLVFADFKVFRVRHIADGIWGPWAQSSAGETWQNRSTSPNATYEVMKLRYRGGNWLSEPGDDIPRFIQGWSMNAVERPACVDILNPGTHSTVPSELDSVHCRNTLNRTVPVQEVSRENAWRWCGITPQRWDVLNGKRTTTSALAEPVSSIGVTWRDGAPTLKDGNTTARFARSLIVIEQGIASARFNVSPQGTGIILVPPPDARSRETYNTQTHQYVNSNPRNGDATGNYPKGPPPGMMSKLAPFAQIAMNAINRAKQAPEGANWDDQYFRNALRPYDTLSASNPH